MQWGRLDTHFHVSCSISSGARTAIWRTTFQDVWEISRTCCASLKFGTARHNLNTPSCPPAKPAWIRISWAPIGFLFLFSNQTENTYERFIAPCGQTSEIASELWIIKKKKVFFHLINDGGRSWILNGWLFWSDIWSLLRKRYFGAHLLFMEIRSQ